MAATITFRDNGPCLVDGDVAIVDAEGHAFEITRRPIALCRCGQSATKPFCDGSHNRAGFQATTRAADQSR